jgi:hypothetical protein
VDQNVPRPYQVTFVVGASETSLFRPRNRQAVQLAR